jgi:mono/diheme cytochrome c family protein
VKEKMAQRDPAAGRVRPSDPCDRNKLQSKSLQYMAIYRYGKNNKINWQVVCLPALARRPEGGWMSRVLQSSAIAVSVILLIAATACAAPNASDPGAGMPAGGMPGEAKPDNVIQGWIDANRVAWYTASQGSRLIPQAWLDRLEQPDSTGMFLDPAYIRTFRYLPNPTAGWENHDRTCPFDRMLPLGFTVDCQSDKNFSITQLRWKPGQSDREPWVGMNCSACHTAEMTYRGTTFRADGGPTLADFQSFTASLALAMHETASDRPKFDRFASSVLGNNASPTDRSALKAALNKWASWNDKLDTLNDPNQEDPAHRIPAYGFGRLDAIGHIYNKVSLVATPASIAHQMANPSDAPTSYPFLWNVAQLDRVEWNGIGVNSVAAGLRYGALGRNTGEVIGVFGDITIRKNPGLGGYTSSVKVKALNDMEEQLARLQPPRWPAAFGSIDPKLAAAGAQVFARDCAECHTVPTRPQGDLTEMFKVRLQPVFPVAGTKERGTGTDFWMACNAALDAASSGLFTGNKTQVVAGTPIQDPAANLVLLSNAVIGVLANQKWEVAKLAIFRSEGLPPPVPASHAAGVDPKQARAEACLNFKDDPADPKMVYKGRPLQGIWATAPYLHNGSVPNLWQLLLPPAQRSKTFYVGTREFDPKNVGYETARSDDNIFLFDASLPGNANTGHDYQNAALTDADRWALIEYMKGL